MQDKGKNHMQRYVPVFFKAIVVHKWNVLAQVI